MKTNEIDKEIKKIASKGLKSLSNPLFSRIDTSNKNIEKTGATFSDPGDINQTLVNKLKKRLNNIIFRKFLEINLEIK